MSTDDPTSFEDAARNAGRKGLIGEFLGFLSENKKWWLLPILVMFGFVGLIIVLSVVAPGALPFTYTFF